ncbi:MAG: alpha-amylase family glycosyl hydrolase [Promethearchaeota archaeon]
MKPSKIAPRIYNFFPRLVGPINKWNLHLTRIKKMNFNWIYMNPVNYTGFSGSMYSIKDYFLFNPVFASKSVADPCAWDDFKGFIENCQALDINFMYDLVINHCSTDSLLLNDHPEWFTEKYAIVNTQFDSPVKFFHGEDKPKLDEDEYPSDIFKIEKRILSPYAIDPADARNIIIWGDLAEINNEDSSDLNGLTKYWMDLIEFYLDLGIDGFRCDAAYQVPSDMWRIIIGHAKSKNPDVVFVAETLGCTLEEMRETVEAGFDYITNSSKWWDYTQPWLLEQYEEFRHYSPSVGFPESHDTIRVAAETNGREDVQKFKYFFATFFSAAVLIPIGYEFGFKLKIDVVRMDPSDWETPIFDISDYIKKVNRFKQAFKCLNEDGKIEEIFYRDPNILILKKSSIDQKESLILIYNKDWNNSHFVRIENLKEFLDLNRNIFRVKLSRETKLQKELFFEKEFSPNEFILFSQE